MSSSRPRPTSPATDPETVHEAYFARRRRRNAVTNEALSNPDIVACVLRGNVGPSTFASASAVSRVWLSACRSDESVLRGVALFQGELTRAKITHLFAILDREANALPHERRSGCLFGAPAVDALLSGDGMAAWRRRLRERAEAPWSPFLLWPFPPPPPRRAPFQEEERLHALCARGQR